jgi:NAD(P)-dependent dehydrogenase (short-subunit alcohol dehydrogenase family)
MFRGRPRKDLIRHHGALAERALEGMNIAIVGGTNGIGRALALAVLVKGAKVKVVGRTFRDALTPGPSFVAVDLSSMAAARRVAQDLSASSLDILVFTNGVMAGRQRRVTSEGIEYDLAVSYLSRYIILREVASTLGVARPTAARKPRVFLMGFPGTDQTGSVDDFNSERSYNLMTAHSNTVVGNEALVLDAAARYPEINVYGLNPGLIKSNIRAAILGDRTILQKIMETFIGLTFPSAETYAARIAPLLVADELEGQSGAMFNSRGEAIEASRAMKDPSFVTRVIDASEELANRALEKAKTVSS